MSWSYILEFATSTKSASAGAARQLVCLICVDTFGTFGLFRGKRYCWRAIIETALWSSGFVRRWLLVNYRWIVAVKAAFESRWRVQTFLAEEHRYLSALNETWLCYVAFNNKVLSEVSTVYNGIGSVFEIRWVVKRIRIVERESECREWRIKVCR